MMTTNELRKRFLDFFRSKQHTIVESDTLVPKNDPSVLFTSAGMNQFKEQFMGNIKGFRRATTVQKCLRTGDLERVGKTPSHHTFFEMLGNFSFGDYFKKEAIAWGWEFLTKDLKISPDKLFVSVYQDDQEAYDIWLKDIKIRKEKIYRFGAKDNFWPSNAIADGPNGPCGPCSEIFFDWGKDVGCKKPECNPSCSCGRFIEIWNLVFTQFNRKDGGVLEPLPSKNIDTGMGLERMAACMQGVKTNFEIDIFKPLVDEIRKLLSLKPSSETQRVNCIADHIRAVTFAVGDGVLPSNDGRGYVIRKLIRRASELARECGFEKPFLYKLVAKVCDVMKEPYPEFLKRCENIVMVVQGEEEKDLQKVEQGKLNIQNDPAKEITGQALFRYYDTYGISVPTATALAIQLGKKIAPNALEDFDRLMEQQRQAARNASNIAGDIFSKEILKLAPTKFIGYETLSTKAHIVQMIQSKKNVDVIKQGDEAWVLLDVTPFYGESGGQIGDTGMLSVNGSTATVIDTKLIDGSTVCVVKIDKGEFRVKQEVSAAVDGERRKALGRSHTATHLLQAALRQVLGDHVQQAGSLVEPDFFRFDFTHFKDVSDEELERVSDLINENIQRPQTVTPQVMKKEEALKSGAMALFGEKYASEVRVISIGTISKELCGGTHLNSTKDIELMVVTSESSIGSGVRRIEALTGKLAHEKMNEQSAMLKQIASAVGFSWNNPVSGYASMKAQTKTLKEISGMLKCPLPDVVRAVEGVLERNKALEKEASIAPSKTDCAQTFSIAKLLECIIERNKKLEKEAKAVREKNIHGEIAARIDKVKKEVGGVRYFLYSFPADIDVATVRATSDFILQKLGFPALTVVGTGSGVALCRVTQDIKDRIPATVLLKKIVEPFGGSGGGRPDFAQGGIKDPSKMNEAIIKAEEIIKKELST